MVEITNDSLIHEFSSFPFTRLFPVDNSQIVAIKRKPKRQEARTQTESRNTVVDDSRGYLW